MGEKFTRKIEMLQQTSDLGGRDSSMILSVPTILRPRV